MVRDVLERCLPAARKTKDLEDKKTNKRNCHYFINLGISLMALMPLKANAGFKVLQTELSPVSMGFFLIKLPVSIVCGSVLSQASVPSLSNHKKTCALKCF